MRAKCLLVAGVVALVLAPLGAEEKEAAKLDPAKLVGTWTYVSGETDGKKVSPDRFKKGSVEITKDTITLKSPEGDFTISYSVDASKTPARISMKITKGPQGEGAKADGIIALKGDELKLCYPAMGGEAPKEFRTKEGSKLHLFTLKRKK
jgi:uncharacterized protein (TIGR03067 family)